MSARADRDADPPTLLAAVLVGLLFPGLETMRRGFSHWAVDFTTMFEDYLAGALLLVGAVAAWRGARWAVPFLAVAWAYATGMMGGSFFHPLEGWLRGAPGEPGDEIVLVVKALLWATCAISTARVLFAVSRRAAS